MISNNDAIFNCTVRGTPLPTVTWLKNGHILSTQKTSITAIANNTSNEITSTLRIISASYNNGTDYYGCYANNSVGSIESNLGYLTVNGKYI